MYMKAQARVTKYSPMDVISQGCSSGSCRFLCKYCETEILNFLQISENLQKFATFYLFLHNKLNVHLRMKLISKDTDRSGLVLVTF